MEAKWKRSNAEEKPMRGRMHLQLRARFMIYSCGLSVFTTSQTGAHICYLCCINANDIPTSIPLSSSIDTRPRRNSGRQAEVDRLPNVMHFRDS